jgi:VanZ family protein
VSPPPASANEPTGPRSDLALCAALALLILYGSWFPFEWIWPHPDDVMWALTDTTVYTGRADLLGNVALFLPWGLVAAAAARRVGRAPATWTLGSGLLLAGLAQAGQFFEAHRDPRWADMLWNGVGTAMGLAASATLARWRVPSALVLGVGSAWVAWLPLWPSLNPDRLQAHWSALTELGLWQGPESAMTAGLALIAGTAAAQWRPRTATWLIPLVALTLLAGMLAVPGTRLSGGSALGLAAGAGLAMALHGSPHRVALALVALQVLGGLAPFDLQAVPQTIHWLPFEALLGGSMLGNTQALARDVWLWGCALWFAKRAHRPMAPVVALYATTAAAIEVVQVWMPSRTADLTPVLIVLALGWVMTRR